MPGIRPISERARKRSAVDKDVLARDEAGPGARQKRAKRAELRRIAEAAGGIARLGLRPRFLQRNSALSDGSRQRRADSVGVEGSGLDRIDRHVVGDMRAGG